MGKKARGKKIREKKHEGKDKRGRQEVCGRYVSACIFFYATKKKIQAQKIQAGGRDGQEKSKG